MGKSRHPRQTRHPRPFPGVYQRSKTDQLSGERIPDGKWEPRMKPRREQLRSGEKLSHEHLPLGGYDTPQDAKIVHDIAAFYYGKAGGELDLANGLEVFSIPAMTEQEMQSLHGAEKRQWVCRRAREIFEDFQRALKAATSMRNYGALVCSEAAATTVVASSAEIPGSPQLASPSPEDSALNPIFGDLQFDNFDIRSEFPIALDSLSVPSLSWDEEDALGSTSKETTSMEMNRVQQQLWESQCENLEMQRQLGEAQIQISELQRQMECVKSKLQNCFCHINWIP